MSELLNEKKKTLQLRYNHNHGADGKFTSGGGGGGSGSGGSNGSGGSGGSNSGSSKNYKNAVAAETKKVMEKASNDVQPFKKEESINMEKVKQRGGVDDAGAKECAAIAENIYNEAAAHEPQITADVISSVEGVDGKMYGLKARLKQPTSMAGKIGQDSKEDNLTFTEAGDNIKDAVRYTAIVDEKNFTNNYNTIKSSLEDKGYKEVRCKNFYELYANGKSEQKAVQCIYEDPQGYKFELQFHTPTSQGAKELNHPLYEEQRAATTSNERKIELGKEMREIGSNVSDPPGVLTIQSHREV